MKTETNFTAVIAILLLTCLVVSGAATAAPYRIRPIVDIKTSLFEGDVPTEVLCIVVESQIYNDYVRQFWVYHLRNYGGMPGVYTTYHARGADLYEHEHVLPHLGEHLMGFMYGYPDYDPPILDYDCTPPIRYAYHVVIHDEPRYFRYVIPEDLINNDKPIAWGKTVNAIAQPKYWWNWTQGGGFEFVEQFPYFPIPNFNNFPHPQGKTNRHGWPEYWPCDSTDHCHWDWCPRDDWPEELPTAEYCAHDWMTLEMVIDDWGTWDELWEEDIEDQGRWVQ